MDNAESSRQGEKRSRDKFGENATIQGENGPLATSNRENVHISQSDDKGTKKKRGPTKLGMIEDRSPPLSIEFNECGQAVGVNSDKYASFIGVITREHVPVCMKNWLSVDHKLKEDLWTLVQEKFVVDESRKRLALRMMGDCWRQIQIRANN